MYEYCVRHDLPEVWAYMFNRWYTGEWWYRWARSSRPDTIPMAKTTMMIEAQWRVLKTNFLKNCPRPRLDLLIWIIVNQQLPIIEANFYLKIKNRRQALDWQKDFAREWKKANKSARTHLERANADQWYIPSLRNWTCGCPSFADSNFMLCKNLVKRFNDDRGTTRDFSALQRNIVRQDVAPYVNILRVCLLH